MATSLSHKLGELIGGFFEIAIVRYLEPIVSEKGFYLDYRHPRPARGNQREVIGRDSRGNKHKLDIVVEKGGSETKIGVPKAYIEMAWRRYKKHSKNKVQEIAGAIITLAQTHAKEIPFYAAVLAGEFTNNAIVQLQSQGFFVLYFTYSEICSLFDTVGVSIRWEEDTNEETIQKIIDDLSFVLSDYNDVIKLQKCFYCMYEQQLESLVEALCNSLDTVITEVIVIPIHGVPQICESIEMAVNFIMWYNEKNVVPILRYEIIVKYNNGEEYTMGCSDKRKAIQFLNQYIC